MNWLSAGFCYCFDTVRKWDFDKRGNPGEVSFGLGVDESSGNLI